MAAVAEPIQELLVIMTVLEEVEGLVAEECMAAHQNRQAVQVLLAKEILVELEVLLQVMALVAEEEQEPLAKVFKIAKVVMEE